MNDTNVEMLAAVRMVEDDARSRDTDAPELARGLGQMRETVEALRAWRRSLEDLPAPAVPSVARRRRRLYLAVSGGAIAAAAAALLIVTLGPWRRPDGVPPDLREQMAWAADVPPASYAPAVAVARSPADESDGRGGKIAAPPMLGGGTGASGGPSAKGGGEPAAQASDPAVRAFLDQFDFAFALPEQLPGGWQLRRARKVGADRAEVLYGRDGAALRVMLSPSVGPDVAFTETEIAGRRMVLGRAGGLALAFEGGKAGADVWRQAAQRFLPEIEE